MEETSCPETAALTADDALASKLSALGAGYFEDALLRERFVRTSCPRKDPLINRGTWFRVRFVEGVVRAFARAFGGRCAVVSLGAGFDTLFWRLPPGERPARWLELDLPEVAERKAQRLGLARGPAPLAFADPAAPGYALHSCNLEEDVDAWLALARAALPAPDAPVLFVAEVVLSYLDSDCTVRILRALPQVSPSAALVAFEMVNPHDPFGEMMTYNMSLRGTFMPTFAEIGYCSQFCKLFELSGYGSMYCREALHAYRDFWPAERARVEALELFDEFEQWNLIMGHYAALAAGCGAVDAEALVRAAMAGPE